MRIIGCDLHARQQTIAMLDRDTGAISERTLTHDGTTVRDFYASVPAPVVVGIEATGSMGWFVRLMEELGVTCRVGDPAKIRASEPRRQKHDRRDARLLLELLSTERFPAIWMLPLELWDLRALLRHRDQWVRLRTRVKNALQGLALAHGIRRRAGLWTRVGQATLAALPLPRYAGQRRSELQALHAHLTTLIDALDHQVTEAAQQRPQARRLMTHPGVAGHGPGDRSLSRRSRTLRRCEGPRQLCRPDSERILERGAAATRGGDQTRECHAAVPLV